MNLFYRLNVVSLKIPALAQACQDIPLLANHLLRQAAERHKPFVRAFSTDAMKRLMTASWPGNVRQLVDVIEQCVALTSSPVISDALVEQALEGENTALPTFVERAIGFELNYLRKLLQITKGNVTHAARMAGRNRTEFYKLLSRHGSSRRQRLSRNESCTMAQVSDTVKQPVTRLRPRNPMKKIDAIIKPFKLDDVREALARSRHHRDDGNE